MIILFIKRFNATYSACFQSILQLTPTECILADPTTIVSSLESTSFVNDFSFLLIYKFWHLQ